MDPSFQTALVNLDHLWVVTQREPEVWSRRCRSLFKSGCSLPEHQQRGIHWPLWASDQSQSHTRGAATRDRVFHFKRSWLGGCGVMLMGTLPGTRPDAGTCCTRSGSRKATGTLLSCISLSVPAPSQACSSGLEDITQKQRLVLFVESPWHD